MEEIFQFVVKHGYWLLFGALFAHQLGVPLPGPLFLLAAGALAAAGKLNFFWVVCITVAACVLADWPWYEAGRRRGDKVLHFIHRFTRDPEYHDRKAKATFARIGSPILLVAKFLPGVDAVSPPLAGTSGTSRLRFLMLDSMGTAIYASTYAGLGYAFRNDLNRVADYVTRAGKYLVWLLPAVLVLYALRKLLLALTSASRIKRINPVPEPGPEPSKDLGIASEFALASFEPSHHNAHVIPAPGTQL